MLSIVGFFLGFAALLGGNFLEGGSLASLVNGPAALIVVGGTIGAAVLQTPLHGLRRAMTLLQWIFRPPQEQFQYGINRVVGWARAARKDGVLGLELVSEREPDPFSRKGLQLLVDGSKSEVIRQVLETDLLVAEQRDHEAAQFFESMGGYAPTVGIIGAVIGLIHVMRHLADPSQLGPGIAIAFVATIYGVAFANLLLIPIANKLKCCIREQSQYKELIIEGLIGIAEGENPSVLETRLSGYLY